MMPTEVLKNPSIDPAVYLRNMRQLWRVDPQLAIRIDAIDNADRLLAERTRSDHHTVCMRAADGASVQLHSRYDPVRESKRLIDAVEIEGQYCYIVTGFGLGYHIRSLFERLGSDNLIIACEPSLPLLATALACHDMSDILATGRLVVLTEISKNALHERLQSHTALMMLGAKFISHPPSERIAPEFYAQMRRLITDFIAYSRTTIMTLVANAKITCRNVANNLAHMVTAPPIDPLRNLFEGKPAIVVSAGPSLRKNIDQLSGLNDRAVICAVQTTLKPLLDRGITPHFVTSLDFHEISARYFEGLGPLDGVHLIAEPKVTWHVTDHYPGPLSLTDNDFARLLIGDELAARDALPPGATVAHLAFYLAQYLGCNPIIFIGQDLAFTGHVFYVPGVEAHRDWDSEFNRFCPIETKEWERIARNRKILRKVKSIDDRTLYTDELLFTYLEQFEKDIAVTDARVINATEGGAHIRGAEVMPLADAISRFCTKPISIDAFAPTHSARHRRFDLLAPARDQLAIRIDEVKDMKNVCNELVERLNELKTLVHDPTRFNQLLVPVDELRVRVNQSQRPYKIISAAAQLAELRRFSADRKLNTDTTYGPDRALRQLQRDIQYVTDVRDGADEMLSILGEALQRLDDFADRRKCDPPDGELSA